MAFSSAWRDSFIDGYDRELSLGSAGLQRAVGATVLAIVACASALVLWTHLSGVDPGAGADRALETDAAVTPIAAARTKLAAALHSHARRTTSEITGGVTVVAKTYVARTYERLAAASKSTAAFFDSHALGFPPGKFVMVALAAPVEPASAPSRGSAAVTGDLAVTGTIGDLPRGPVAPRPSRVPPVRVASLHDDATAGEGEKTPAEEAPAGPLSIFEKLFGKPAPLTLAYAAPDDAGLGAGRSVMPGRYDRWTAVYDISAHTVYLPDGSKLEAHSGLGSRLDDPRHTDERMHGATPAAIYDLKLREGLFHGVQALRLVPVDDDKVFGRSGLLAHTYMLGANGQSNGCVSFRDYNAFLQAYLHHEIKRLAVVDRLD
jgi:Protein of unknown function (DUF2778)